MKVARQGHGPDRNFDRSVNAGGSMKYLLLLLILSLISSCDRSGNKVDITGRGHLGPEELAWLTDAVDGSLEAEEKRFEGIGGMEIRGKWYSRPPIILHYRSLQDDMTLYKKIIEKRKVVVRASELEAMARVDYEYSIATMPLVDVEEEGPH